MLLRTFLSTTLGKYMHAILQGVFLGAELLGHGECVFSNLLDNAKLFSKVVVPAHKQCVQDPSAPHFFFLSFFVFGCIGSLLLRAGFL